MPDYFRIDMVRKFYDLLDRLAAIGQGWRKFEDCISSRNWPEQGLYFVSEESELRSVSGMGRRVVRVGTHGVSKGSQSNLLSRLKSHNGFGNGGGNHRRSIFRKRVGEALIRKNGIKLPSWGIKNLASNETRALEFEHEREVTEIIRNMGLLVLEVPGVASKDNLRHFLEKNSISLLGLSDGGPIDPPSKGWLGHYSLVTEIRESGLWCQRYVNGHVDPDFLGHLEKAIG